MDKKSNRTDLLAAGRKKLQQYRQKKDTKGKDGKGKDGKGSSKSTNKGDKSEHNDADVDIVSTAKMKAESSKLPEKEVESSLSLLSNVEKMNDSSTDSQKVSENTASISTDSRNVDQFPPAALEDLGEQSLLDVNAHQPDLDPAVVEASLSHKLGCNPPNEEEELEIGSQVEGLGMSGSTELENVHNDVSTPNPNSANGAAYHSEAVATVPLEAEGSHEGDQVSVVGAMQEADSFIPTHCDQSVELKLGGDSKISISVDDGGRETPSASGDITEKMASCEPDQKFDVSDIAISECYGHHETVGASVVEMTCVATETNARSPREHQQGEDVVDGSSDERAPYLQYLANDTRYYENKANQADLERRVDKRCDGKCLYEPSSTIGVQSDENLIENRSVDSIEEQSVYPGLHDKFVNLLQVAELLKRLPEDDFRYLMKSREMVDHSNLVARPRSGMGDLPETFQEKLYLANILKDFFQLQLVEQHEQQSGIDHQRHPLAVPHPLSDVQERNKSLTAKLSQCRSELEDAIREKVELQNSYHSAKEDVEYSAKVDELQMKLEESVGELSSISGELVNCKVLLEASLVEIEKLRESLASVSEQRNKVEEITQQYVDENRRLSTDLADSSAQLAAVQQEVINLETSIASINDEKKKFEEEKEFLVHEKEMLLGDLADCRISVTALEQENAGLNMNLGVVTEELDKLKEREEFLTVEIKRLSAELVVFQDKMSIQHLENMQLEADLKETISRLEQLAEENIILQSSLEISKAKLAEVDNGQIQHSSQAGGVGTTTRSKCQDSTADIDSSLRISLKEEVDSVVPDDTSESTGLNQLRMGLHYSSGVVALKEHLEEAEKLMQKLEKAMDGMHAQSASPSRSAGKAAGVSKLIQAFESKTHVDGHGPEGNPSPESLLLFDPYPSAKEELDQLRAVFMALAQNVEHVNTLIIEEKDGHNAVNAAPGELEVEIEVMKGFNINLELRNIELEVLCGAMNQYVRDIEAKKIRLFEGLQRHEVQLNEIRRSSGEVALVIYNEVETLQRKTTEDICAVDRQWKSGVAELVPMVEKLVAVVGSAVSSPYHIDNSDDLDVFDHFALSLSNACEVIEQLKMRLEVAGKDHEALSSSYMEVKEKLQGCNEKHSLAIGLLKKLSGDIVHLLNVSGEHVGESDIQTRENNPHDSLDASYYEDLVTKLGNLLGNMLQLKESNKKICSDLLDRTDEIEQLNKKYVDGDGLLKIILDVKEALKLQDSAVDFSEAPVVHLQSLVLLLIKKYTEAEEEASILSNDVDSRMIEFGELRGRVELLESSNIQQQIEILGLRESVRQAKVASDAMQAQFLDKVKEVEQSEQRVASVREKLSIAVAKGKGLVVQRDSLKQSLTEMSSEVEKYSQELRLKDSRVHEAEEKLKAYSEAGERMEALESELSYIRNSATALRESFLLKDSALQRIEEILEDLELPEQFHSKDVTEKVDWLAKSVAGNSLPPADWDQRSSVGGGSYSDTGFIATDGSKEDVLQPTSNPVDDLGREYHELQTKYYELAEQNDMLEQSLMERNILVQRWEEILDRINTPPQIRSMEPEERIHWLGTALSEADNHIRSLQQKVENLENYCGSLSGNLEESQRRISEHESSFRALLHEKETALSEAEGSLKSLQQQIGNLENYCGSLSIDLEQSRRRISELESPLQEVLHDKETLSSNLVSLTSDHESVLDIVAQYEQEADKLGQEIDMLQKKLVEKTGNEDEIHWIESEVRRLQGFILDVLQGSSTENVPSDVSSIQYLERLIRRLVNNDRGFDTEYHGPREAVQEHVTEQASLLVEELKNDHSPDELVANLDDPKSRSTVCEGDVVADLRSELAEALDEVVNLREERNTCMQKNQSLAREIETLEMKLKEFKELLNQEEQKSASLREKLNLAVRKGKSLVQQRDSQKQNIEEMTAEIAELKSVINNQEHALVESRQNIIDLSFLREQYNAMESENLSLQSRLVEAEQQLHQTVHTLSMILSKLGADSGDEINGHDPLQKLEGIGKLCSDLNVAVASFEQEANKSKKAAELLLAELNEVQERNDGLQEEIARAYDEISILSRERDLADSANAEALSYLGEERRKQLGEFERLNSSVHEVKKGFFEISTLIGDLFAKDKEFLHNVSTHLGSCLEQIGADSVVTKDYDDMVSMNSRFEDFWSTNSSWHNKLAAQLDEKVGLDDCKVIGLHVQQLAEAIIAFKERIHSHSKSLDREADQLTDVISAVLRGIASQRDSYESIKGQCTHLESIMKEKDVEGVVMNRIISLLYEACVSSIMEIENRKAQLVGECVGAGDLRVNIPALPSAHGGNFSGFTLSSSENSVKALADKLLLTVKDFVDIETLSIESHSKEMRRAILNLQKELQEKDVQRERISKEFASQIKAAEATAVDYSQDLQSMKNYAQELESKLEATEREQSSLKQRVAELQQEHSSSIDLGEKVKSLAGMVAAKEQEIEALMQALDEEENQMEALRNRVDESEKIVEQKNMDLEHVEASRAKAVKKLSVTVSKFDELHHMSEGLLSEIENLQSQLQDRDADISFLRQEVTRCTNDVLEATKMAKERSSGELHEFLSWLDTKFSQVLMHDGHGGEDNANHDHKCKEHLQKDVTVMITELENLRIATQRKDALLLKERHRAEDLSLRLEALEVSLQEKVLHLNSLQNVGGSGLGTSEILEVQPVLNKWAVPVTSTASQVRSLRKVNNEQVAIAIDTDAGSSGRFEDDEDDKVHGFKSLTTSRFVPKFTRPVSDMIDGLWVSCDRALMRQPAFRLGIMIYWGVLHALLASLIV